MTTTYHTTATGIQYASTAAGRREAIVQVCGQRILTARYEGREHVEDGEVAGKTLREAWRVAVGDARRWARGDNNG